jgi:hypothetical protein
MAYQHHPQAPAPQQVRPATVSRTIKGAVTGLLLVAAVSAGAWYLLRSPGEVRPVLTAVGVDTRPPPQEPMAPPAPIREARQSETVRGALVLPDAETRLLQASDLAGLSAEQLQRARTEILARNEVASAAGRRASEAEPGARLSEIEAANLRLIEQALKAR